MPRAAAGPGHVRLAVLVPVDVTAEMKTQGPSVPASGLVVYIDRRNQQPMVPSKRSMVGGVPGVRPDPVYRATEGFIGAACARGTLHLDDDSMVVDLEPVAGTDGFWPIVTDLRRRVQPVVSGSAVAKAT